VLIGLIGKRSLSLVRIHHVAGSNGGHRWTVIEWARILCLILSRHPPHPRRLMILSTLLDFHRLHLCIATALWTCGAAIGFVLLSLRYSAIAATEPSPFLVHFIFFRLPSHFCVFFGGLYVSLMMRFSRANEVSGMRGRFWRSPGNLHCTLRDSRMDMIKLILVRSGR
jgi:hypothetical protein